MIASNVMLDVDGSAMPCHIARPDEHARRPGVIVLQEIFGVNAEIRRIAQLLAETGYVAFAPNFFHRTAPTLDAPYSAEGMAIGVAAASAVTTADLRLDIRASIRWLASQSFVDASRIGAWGFCMGASVAFLAAREAEVRCALCFYGAQIARPWRSGDPPALEHAAELTAPLLLVFGGRDHSIPPDAVATIESTLRRLGKRFELIVYPDADHAFFRHGGSERDRVDVADAWRRASTFLATQLGSTPHTGHVK